MTSFACSSWEASGERILRWFGNFTYVVLVITLVAQNKPFLAQARVDIQSFINPSIMSTSDVLVIIMGNLRGGEVAWSSMYRHLLEPNNAHCALVVGNSGDRRPAPSSLYRRCKYTRKVPEYLDWGEALDIIRKNRSNSVPDWRRPWHNVYGGIKDRRAGILRGSGAIIFFMRWVIKRLIVEEDLLSKYQYFVVTRSDHFYACRHPLIHELDKSLIWVPEGMDAGGITDRHIVCIAEYIMACLSIIDPVIENPLRYDNVSTPFLQIYRSPESLIKFRFIEQRIWDRVRRYPRVLFTCAEGRDQSRWRHRSNKVDPLFRVFTKYTNEYYRAVKVCNMRLPVVGDHVQSRMGVKSVTVNTGASQKFETNFGNAEKTRAVANPSAKTIIRAKNRQSNVQHNRGSEIIRVAIGEEVDKKAIALLKYLERHPRNRTLVIVFDRRLYGGERAWASLYRHVLDANSADCAVITASGNHSNHARNRTSAQTDESALSRISRKERNNASSLIKRCAFVWTIADRHDWGDAINEMMDGWQLREWWRRPWPNIYGGSCYNGSVLPGYRTVDFSIFRELRKLLDDNSLTVKYDRFVLARTDNVYRSTVNLSFFDDWSTVWVSQKNTPFVGRETAVGASYSDAEGSSKGAGATDHDWMLLPDIEDRMIVAGYATFRSFLSLMDFVPRYPFLYGELAASRNISPLTAPPSALEYRRVPSEEFTSQLYSYLRVHVLNDSGTVGKSSKIHHHQHNNNHNGSNSTQVNSRESPMQQILPSSVIVSRKYESIGLSGIRNTTIVSASHELALHDAKSAFVAAAVAAAEAAAEAEKRTLPAGEVIQQKENIDERLNEKWDKRYGEIHFNGQFPWSSISWMEALERRMIEQNPWWKIQRFSASDYLYPAQISSSSRNCTGAREYRRGGGGKLDESDESKRGKECVCDCGISEGDEAWMHRPRIFPEHPNARAVGKAIRKETPTPSVAAVSESSLPQRMAENPAAFAQAKPPTDILGSAKPISDVFNCDCTNVRALRASYDFDVAEVCSATRLLKNIQPSPIVFPTGTRDKAKSRQDAKRVRRKQKETVSEYLQREFPLWN